MKVTAKIARLAALGFMLTGSGHVIAQAPHEGVWTSVDPFDGSRAYIGVNSAWQIVFFDSDATFGCREGGGGPFIGFDENNGNTVRLEGHVMVGHIDGACQNGGKNQNTSFDLGMGHFPEYDTIRSRGTDWDRTSHDPETFVANAFELEKLSAGAWEFFSGFSGGDPQIIPGIHCENVQEGINGLELSIGNGSDLRGCDLASVTISGQSVNALLREAYMAHANILEAKFWSSDLSAADMHGATITRGYFEDSNLRYVNLSGVIFQDTYFINNVDLVGADLRYARADLGGSYSDGHLDLRRANLTGVDFSHLAIYGSVDFRNANLTRAKIPWISGLVIFGNTICPDGSNSDDNGGTCDL